MNDVWFIMKLWKNSSKHTLHSRVQPFELACSFTIFVLFLVVDMSLIEKSPELYNLKFI